MTKFDVFYVQPSGKPLEWDIPANQDIANNLMIPALQQAEVWEKTEVWMVWPDFFEGQVSFSKLPAVVIAKHIGPDQVEVLTVLEGGDVDLENIRNFMLYWDAQLPEGNTPEGAPAPFGSTMGWSLKFVIGLLGFGKGEDITPAQIKRAVMIRDFSFLGLGLLGIYALTKVADKE